MDYHREGVFPGGKDVKVFAGNSGSNAPMKFDIGLPQLEPPVKKLRSSEMEEVSRSKAIAKILYKTKLCSKFRAGTCRSRTTCNFAHGREELRKPPPNWKEMVAAAREEDEAVSVDTEQAKARGSEAITIERIESDVKTRVCSKWEMMGFCPVENRCHFAHGVEDLYGHSAVHGEAELATTPTEAMQGVLPPKTPAEVVVGASEGEKRSRKEKIREIISILQSMIPGGKDKRVAVVIDEAIEYLKSLKVKARDLGFDTL